ncbi:MAG: tRNA (cytidine(34)-2'-O)-methyltransferase [Cyanobacteria bacterium]|nr:tRNA (cytidine(34)-2'-O)-methyltransferase [Cyanobacteriota bacterium]
MPRVVLFQPQIPPNTGNVARTCAATATELHLIEPLGFQMDDRQLRRAGLDYWPLVPLSLHPDLRAFLAHQRGQGGRLIALSSHAAQSYDGFSFRPDDWLLFGRETDGLPRDLQQGADARLTIPLARPSLNGTPGVRSLNLSVAVGVVLFEAIRQLNSATAPWSPPSGSGV